jgi:thiamine phosphate synthase YjbQ (UPF0047 family)
VNDDDKQKYVTQITKAVWECLNTPDIKHGLLITANDTTATISMYSINADEEILPALLTAATRIVHSRLDIEPGRVLN